MKLEPQRRVDARLLRIRKVRPWYQGWPMLGLLLLLILAAAVWRRESTDQHPLRETTRTELCSLLPPPPLELAVRRQAVQSNETHAATCEYFGADDKLVLRVTLRSTAQLSSDGGTRAPDVLARRMKDVRHLYGRGGPVPGPWESAGAWHVGLRQALMFEDEGVLVLLESERLDAEALAAHAAAVMKSLRHLPKGTT